MLITSKQRKYYETPALICVNIIYLKPRHTVDCVSIDAIPLANDLHFYEANYYSDMHLVFGIQNNSRDFPGGRCGFRILLLICLPSVLHKKQRDERRKYPSTNNVFLYHNAIFDSSTFDEARMNVHAVRGDYDRHPHWIHLGGAH